MLDIVEATMLPGESGEHGVHGRLAQQSITLDDEASDLEGTDGIARTRGGKTQVRDEIEAKQEDEAVHPPAWGSLGLARRMLIRAAHRFIPLVRSVSYTLTRRR